MCHVCVYVFSAFSRQMVAYSTHGFSLAFSAQPGEFCSVSLPMTVRMEMAAVPSAWVPEQEDVRNKGTGDPHLLSNPGER